MATPEQERIERLLAQQESSIRRAFEVFLADVRGEEVLRQVREFLEQGRIEPALEIVDSHVVRLARVIPRAFENAGDAEAQALAASVAAGAPLSRVAISFDPTHPRAAEMMRRDRLRFIQGFTRQQRDSTRTALVRAFTEGLGIPAVAAAFRDSIGLTPTQLRAVANYRRLLELGSREVLDRSLRDRRFDRTVERAISTREPLTADQIDRMTGRYHKRFIDLRAETIARTEGGRVTEQARREAMQQNIEQIGLDPNLVEREWMATMDPRTRDTHAAMNGQVVGLNEPFISPSGARLMFPHDPDAPPSETVNCRCAVSTRIRQVGEASRAA